MITKKLLFTFTSEKRSTLYIGENIRKDQQLWQHLVREDFLCIVTNTSLTAYLEDFKKNFPHQHITTIILADGECHKTLDSWKHILEKLIDEHHPRNTTLIALGGGVIGDITGFAAACYQRGTNFIQVPTSLLAQVDASLGGKVGINLGGFKNMLGAIYQPHAIVIDVAFLASLPQREYFAGLAEVIKYALLSDTSFFDYLQDHTQAILDREAPILHHVIETCCQIKMNIVSQDEHDEKGLRALLNLGHTFAHALESASDYTFLHGEAVAWGLRKACELSVQLSYLSEPEENKINTLLKKLNLWISLPTTVSTEKLVDIMRQDKKNKNHQIHFILLKAIGEAFVTNTVNLNILQDVMRNNLC